VPPAPLPAAFGLGSTGTIVPTPPTTQPSTTPGTSRVYTHLPQIPPVSTYGDAGYFTLDTAGMVRCGYVIELWSSDRTIWSSVTVGTSKRATVGFCLRNPGT